MRKVLGILFVLLLVAGCSRGRDISSTQTFEVTLTENLAPIKVIQITSDYHYFDQKQADIAPRLDQLINSGKYNITSVSTSYSSSYLTAAQVTYTEKPGAGNHIRVALLVSGYRYLDQKQAEVKPQFDAIVNDPIYEVVKVQSIYDRGYLIAAEIYYRVQ